VRLLGGERSHVDGLGAFLALGDVELDGLPLVQRATVLDGAGVDEPTAPGSRRLGTLGHPGRLRGDGTCAAA
jgi:hypothetical protein